MTVTLNSLEQLIKYAVENPQARFTLHVPYNHPDTGSYFLRRAGGYTRADLSVELGKQLSAIWKQKPAYRGSTATEPIGMLSIATMLNRLGETGQANRITELREKIQAQVNKERRNRMRENFLRHYDLFIEQAGHFGEIGITPEMFRLTDEAKNLLKLEE
jgi:hypothetical protein